MLSTPEASRSASDIAFRRTVVLVTSLSLAALYGWLACYERKAQGVFYFSWHWNGLIWLFIGFGSTAYFWHKIWSPIGHTTVMRKDVLKGSLAFALPNLWWLTFPLRLNFDQHSLNLVTSLIVAGTVVAIDARIVNRLVKAFEETDADDLKALNSSNADSNAESTKK